MKHYFTKGELALWSGSVGLILLAFFRFDKANYLTLIASLIGATSLIFNAKGNPFGQFLMVIFSVLYGIICYACRYYGELLTYVGMTGPMALFALIAWLRHPFKGKRSEVEVNGVKLPEILFMLGLSVVVTAVFYVILRHWDTANLIPSTLSVTTSFIAVYLTFRRSPWFAVAYAANDIVLLVLWVLAAMEDSSYLSVIVCFVTFLVNDIYGFISWIKMEKRQKESAER